MVYRIQRGHKVIFVDQCSISVHSFKEIQAKLQGFKNDPYSSSGLFLYFLF